MTQDNDFEPDLDDLDDDFDPEMEDDGMTEMVNVSDAPIIVRISQGTRVQKTRIKPGESARFPEGYCRDVPGAGKSIVLPSILTRQSLREDLVPRLVRRDQADLAREYFVSRVYGSNAAAASEVDVLEAELKAAKARAASIAERQAALPSAKPKPQSAAAKAKAKARAKAKAETAPQE